MISWLCLLKVDDWADFECSPSRAAALHNYANNALRYEAIRHLLTIEKRRRVVTGLSTIKPGLDPRTAYVYNTRMGFEAVPVHRVLLPCWWLRPLVATRPAAWFWSATSRLMPRFSILQRAAGLAQFMSGLEQHPLAWAETGQEEGDQDESP